MTEQVVGQSFMKQFAAPFAAERGLPARIAAVIGRQIIAGELKPGETLPREVDLLEQFQVSRTTLREALKILSTIGFLEAKPKLGTRVRSTEHWNTLDPVVLSWHEETDDQPRVAEELFELRLSIEPLVARLAARRATGQEIAEIRNAFERMSGAYQSVEEAIQADIDFHLAIFYAAHNRFLVPVASAIRTALLISVPRTFARSGGFADSLVRHAAILQAIEARDEKAASRLCQELLTVTYARNFE